VTGSARRIAGTALIVAITAAGALAADAGLRPVELVVRPIGRFLTTQDDTRFGQLEFRGGLELAAADWEFGSLSGLDFTEDGSLLAVSDKGRWFSARPVMEDGRLVGLTDGAVAPILNSAGDALSGKLWGDAEGVRIVERDGRPMAVVVFERINDVRTFAGPDFVTSRSVDVPMPQSFKAMTGKDGAEAIAVAPASGPLGGAVVVIAELLRTGGVNTRGWIVGGPKAGTFAVRRFDDYDVTDIAFLRGGDLLLLERKYGFPYGIAARLRRIAADDLGPGRTIDGPIIFEATLGHQIDNMEGLAITKGPDGETIVALLSDNNQNPLQRTLLLYFALVEEKDSTARSRE
jgi:hypothetical protein